VRTHLEILACQEQFHGACCGAWSCRQRNKGLIIVQPVRSLIDRVGQNHTCTVHTRNGVFLPGSPTNMLSNHGAHVRIWPTPSAWNGTGLEASPPSSLTKRCTGHRQTKGCSSSARKLLGLWLPSTRRPVQEQPNLICSLKYPLGLLFLGAVPPHWLHN